MWPQWINMLSWPQWALLAAIPPAIVALYFLKLKRQPVEVPSTYLWRKSIEDLHVNSLWQRLRQSLLMFLQLLVMLLVILALLRPSWSALQSPADRYIYLIDNSASMSTTDVAPTRLEAAKEHVRRLIDELESGDVAMIISFSDGAQVVEPFTDNRGRLTAAVARIQPTQRRTNLVEALVMASGLANPPKVGDLSDTLISEAQPAELHIVSDGRFPDVKGFSLGNLEPVFVPIGTAKVANIGIAAFGVSRNTERPDRQEAFASIRNYGTNDATVEIELYLDGELKDADRIENLEPGQMSGVAFPLDNIETGQLELRSLFEDAFALDNRAWAAVNAPQRAKVLFVAPSGGDDFMQFALLTERAVELADVDFQTADYLTDKDRDYKQRADGGYYDLIIYDRCAPETMPQANTFFIGSLPAGDIWSAEEPVPVPQVIDSDNTHPLMQYIRLVRLMIYEGRPLDVPSGGTVLIDTHVGPMFVVAPREGFEDAVLGFAFLGEVDGEAHVFTDWPKKRSFPVFVLNVLSYLGGQGDHLASGGSLQPGQTIGLRSDTLLDRVSVRTPSAQTIEVKRGSLNAFNFVATNELGIYEVSADGMPEQRFTVNLFDGAESDVGVRADQEIKIGHVKVEGKSAGEVTRREIWKWLLLLALAVLLFEWYVYNRRVYI